MTKQREYFVKRKRLPGNPRKPFDKIGCVYITVITEEHPVESDLPVQA